MDNLELFNLMFYRTKLGEKKYHCVIYPHRDSTMMVNFESSSLDGLIGLLRYFGFNPALTEETLSKQFWVYDCPILPESHFEEKE